MDPQLLAVIAQLLGAFTNQTPTQQVSGLEPSDTFQRSQTTLPGITPEEQALAQLQQTLGAQTLRAGTEAMPANLSLGALAGGDVGGINLASLASGQLSPEQQTRIHNLAFGGINQGINRAIAQASDAALAQGVPLSTMQYANQANLIQPLIAEAGRTEAGLSMQELDRLAALRSNELSRLGDLRQRSLGNMLALQDSPALNRLLSLRMAEAQRSNLDMSRFPGGLPDYAYGPGGTGSSERAPTNTQSNGIGGRLENVGNNLWSLLGANPLTWIPRAAGVDPVHWIRGWFS